jgi:O-antigen/teichoic acid export membrane protein
MPTEDPQAQDGPRPASLVFNSSAMLIAAGFNVIVTSALAIYAIRKFSVDAYASYSIAWALITIFALLSEMGLQTVAIREMAMHPRNAQRDLGVALVAECATSVVVGASMVPIGLVLGYSAEIIGLLAIGAAYLFFQGVLTAFDAPFRARRTLLYSAVVASLHTGLTAFVGFALIWFGVGPAALVIAMAVGYALAIPAAAALCKKRLGMRPVLAGARRATWPFIRTAIPIAATAGLVIVYDKLDLLLLASLDEHSAAAIYGVPLTVVATALILPAVIVPAFFPLLAPTLRDDPAQARSSFFLMLRIFLFISVPASLILAFASTELVTAIAGDRYRASGEPLAILGVSIVLGFINYLLWYGLLAAYQERRKLLIVAVGLGINVGLNLLLIPPYGPTGAAIALVLSDVLIVGWQGVLIHRSIFAFPLRGLLAKPLAAAALGALTGLALMTWSGVAAGFLAAGVYAIALQALRYVSVSEWAPLLDPIRRLARRRSATAGAR